MLEGLERFAPAFRKQDDLTGDNISERLAFSAGQQSVFDELRKALANATVRTPTGGPT